MLISYRDSKRYPSDALALQAWVKMAEAMARQVVCREFDALQFARALEVCRRLTRKDGPEAIRRMIHACAAAGVAVVLVPATTDCHASSASRWLVPGRKAMIALSIRYRRDDQIYFSLFREAGAILMAHRQLNHGVAPRNTEGPQASDSVLLRETPAQRVVESFSPDRFAREFLIPPEYDGRLAALAHAGKISTTESHGVTRSRRNDDSDLPPCPSVSGAEGSRRGESLSASAMGEAICAFAAKLGIAPGLVVGRMQHDSLLPWTHQNRLKRVVDLSYVLEASEAVEETWPDQQTAARAVMMDFNMEAAEPARKRVARAVARGELLTNGRQRCQMRIEPGGLVAWRLAMRNRDLDAEDAKRQEAA